MIIIKVVAVVLLFNLALAADDYENAIPMQIIELPQNDKRVFQDMTRMLRDPGWRHIGLGKRSMRAMTNGKTWSMIGLGR